MEQGSARGIRIRVTGVFLGQPMNETIEEPYMPNDTPKTVFARLDKKKSLGRKFFKGVVKGNRATLLLNGDRLDLPEELDRLLNKGDEISVLSAIAGG